MKNTKYLDFYKKCMKTGELPGGFPRANGLCNLLPKEDREIIRPTEEDRYNLIQEGLCDAYWASEMLLVEDCDRKGAYFNPLRQTIVLLLAAINGEL